MYLDAAALLVLNFRLRAIPCDYGDHGDFANPRSFRLPRALRPLHPIDSGNCDRRYFPPALPRLFPSHAFPAHAQSVLSTVPTVSSASHTASLSAPATKALASFALHVARGLNCLGLMCLRVRSLAKLVLIRIDPRLSAADFFPPLVRAHLRSSVANCFPVLIRDHPRESAVNFPSLFRSRAMSGSPASPMLACWGRMSAMSCDDGDLPSASSSRRLSSAPARSSASPPHPSTPVPARLPLQTPEASSVPRSTAETWSPGWRSHTCPAARIRPASDAFPPRAPLLQNPPASPPYQSLSRPGPAPALPPAPPPDIPQTAAAPSSSESRSTAQTRCASESSSDGAWPPVSLKSPQVLKSL